MVRPRKTRKIGHRPNAVLYKPAGIPASQLNSVELSLDELEAMRLVDTEHLDQAAAAERINVSRATVGRMLASGREKVTKALAHGMAIVITTDSNNGQAEIEFYETCPRHGRGCRNPTKGASDESSNQQ